MVWTLMMTSCAWIGPQDQQALCQARGWCDTGLGTTAVDTGDSASTTTADSGTTTGTGSTRTTGGLACPDPEVPDGSWPSGYLLYEDAELLIEGKAGFLEQVGHSYGSGDFDGDCVPELVISAEAHVQGGGVCPSFLPRWTRDDGIMGVVEATALPTGWDFGEVAAEPGETCGRSMNPRALTDLLGSGIDALAVTAQLAGESGVTTTVLLFDGWSPDIDTDDAVARITVQGSQAYEYRYASGDLDGDGVEDLVVGDVSQGEIFSSQGIVFLFQGAPSGDVDTSQDAATLGPGDLTETYMELGDQLVVCDTDGDGTDELVAALEGRNSPWEAGPQVGVFSLVAGLEPGTTTDFDQASFLIQLQQGMDFVDAVACGDLDGSGHPTLAIGSRDTERDEVGDQAQDGVVFLFDGPVSGDTPYLRQRTDARTRINGELGARLGASVALPGDVDGDGAGDLLVGADQAVETKGSTTLLTGPIPEGVSYMANLDDGAAVFVGWNQAGVGVAVGGLGDLDWDERADVGDAHQGWGEAGGVFLFFGGPATQQSRTGPVEAAASARQLSCATTPLGRSGGPGLRRGRPCLVVGDPGRPAQGG